MKSPSPLLSIAYFGFYGYHFYTAYELIGSHDLFTYLIPVVTLIHALFLGSWAYVVFRRYYVLISLDQTFKERTFLHNPTNKTMIPKPLTGAEKR